MGPARFHCATLLHEIYHAKTVSVSRQSCVIGFQSSQKCSINDIFAQARSTVFRFYAIIDSLLHFKTTTRCLEERINRNIQ